METTQICDTMDAVGFERTRFFSRQLVGHQDFMDMQQYFLNRMRHHNRMLHGWGIVCGLKVKQAPNSDCEVIIQAGHALGPQGDDIIVTEEVTIDLCAQNVDGNVLSPCGSADPWCSDIRVNRPVNRRMYLAIRYAECLTRPVRVQSMGCGCDDGACEYSRVRSSYAITLLDRLPDGYSDPMNPPDTDTLLRCREDANGNLIGPDCPTCPSEPWVILADVTFSTDGKIGNLECNPHRRYVASFADFFFMCQSRDESGGVREVAANVMKAVGLASTEAPTMLIGVKRADASVAYLPVYESMRAEAGETIATFLEREGARIYRDPVGDERYTLNELYAMAGADPQATVNGLAEALRPLEGVTLRASELRATRADLARELEQDGVKLLEKEHAGAPAGAVALPATAIRGVSERSTLGGKIKEMTIDDVAATPREAFVAMAVEGVADRQKTAVETQANTVWERAARVASISGRWRG